MALKGDPGPGPPPHPPLSWKEARSRLKQFLEEYIKNQNPTPVERREQTLEQSQNNLSPLLRWCLRGDLDFYIGAAGASAALLIIASLAFAHSSNEATNFSFHKSEFIASTLVFTGCVINVWLIRRRRFSTSLGSDGLKRRMILRFLKKIEKQEEECVDNETDDNLLEGESDWNLAGSSLTGIFPVYRRSQRSDGKIAGGSWSRIPTNLLVEGDHIALQVGDITPAACRVADGPYSEQRIEAGTRISLETYENSRAAVESLPRGRTTLPEDSDELLTLTNNMRIFVVLENPLQIFLMEPCVESRKPQLLRQLEVIRAVLLIMGFSLFIITIAILFVRVGLESKDLSLSLPVPFLVAIGIFPFSTSACLVFIEALATARILSAYHPVAALRHQEIPSESEPANNIDMLLVRYFLAAASNRLSLQDFGRKMRGVVACVFRFLGIRDESEVGSRLVRIPPASVNLIEKLGVATAFTLVDDELVCEPDALPQQLLIPSGKGLKLLDICPEGESDDDGDSDSDHRHSSRKSYDGDLFDSDDSDSDDGLEHHHHHIPSRRKHRRLLRIAHKDNKRSDSGSSSSMDSDNEVQFEDPLWWQHLPSLKCIGLACLLVDQNIEERCMSTALVEGSQTVVNQSSNPFDVQEYKTALVRLICAERRSMQLSQLAQCIGFSTKADSFGENGDITPFVEEFRLHVVNTSRLRERLEIDSHERRSWESRWWGLLRPDSTSVIVRDNRSGAYQLVTVGDPRIVTRMCQEAWQGENSTILPLAAHDRATILETSDSWKLADLDVHAFSYAPIPHTFEARCKGNGDKKSKLYLLDNDPRGEPLFPTQKDKTASSGEWPLLHNQIFLGILGSLVVPRQETQGLLRTLQDAGVRFVYFSPRNMRLTKEIASQMGIDVAWNCAISLRPLDQGDTDPHRMVSTYADWDVNAKLPHGIESVKRHLKEVDNVPLLVSLFTDVTKITTAQMIETFQEYHDTVIAVGLSHLRSNSRIFSTADLSVGVDILTECLRRKKNVDYNSLLHSEIIFISAISAHGCAFRLRGVGSIAYMPTILAQGRASLEASIAASLFLICGGLSFAFYALFSLCSVATVLPVVPIVGAVLFLQVVLPLVGLPITMSDPEKHGMQRVPPKNDSSITFAKREGKVLFRLTLLKALPPAVFPHLLYLIAFGEFMIQLEPALLSDVCSPDLQQGDWTSVIRCHGMSSYSGESRMFASSLALAEFMICIIVASSSFVHRTLPLSEEPPWQRNHIWVYSVALGLLVTASFLLAALEKGILSLLPWYFYVLACAMPFLCVLWNELLKRSERTVLDRAEKLRRLQFETRLGMWSPK